MSLQPVEKGAATVVAALVLVVLSAACAGSSEGINDRGSTEAVSSAPSSATPSPDVEAESFADEFSAELGAMSTSLLWCMPPFEDSQIEPCSHLLGKLPEVVGELRTGLQARSDADQLTDVAEALDALEEPMTVLAEDCDSWAANGAPSDGSGCVAAWFDFSGKWNTLEAAAGYPDLS